MAPLNFRFNQGVCRVAEASTQTSEPEEPTYENEVEAILSHKTEGARMGVRFLVKWRGYNIRTEERWQKIVAKGGGQLLANYMRILEIRCRRRYQAILRNQPGLAQLLVEVESSSQQSELNVTD